MSLLSRFQILTKILAVIGLLSAVAIGITALSISALKSLADLTVAVDIVSASGIQPRPARCRTSSR